MDTELARTFLAVVAAGNFIGASRRLNVAQSTVSTRMQALEESLGSILFVRNKAGAVLTPAGRQFQRHASDLVRTVERARQDIGVARGYEAVLTVAGRFGLWEQLLLQWLPRMRRQAPRVSIRAEVGFEADLMQGLVEGRIDIGVMYTPQSRPGLEVEPLLEERLVLAVTDRGRAAGPGGDGYVYLDWGPEFYARHATRHPDFPGHGLSANIGWLGLNFMLANGGSGYFPLRLLRPYLAAGHVFLVDEIPAISLPAYLVYPAQPETEYRTLALAGIRALAKADQANGRGAMLDRPAQIE